MIHPGSLKHRVLTALAAMALLLRIAVPVGFMPSSFANGWFLELCPDGLPAHVMVALYGEHHAHHGAGGDSVFYECDYGGGAAGALLIDCSILPWEFLTSADQVAAVEADLVTSTRLFAFRSRAPPSLVRYIQANQYLTNV